MLRVQTSGAATYIVLMIKIPGAAAYIGFRIKTGAATYIVFSIKTPGAATYIVLRIQTSGAAIYIVFRINKDSWFYQIFFLYKVKLPTPFLQIRYSANENPVLFLFRNSFVSIQKSMEIQFTAAVLHMD